MESQPDAPRVHVQDIGVDAPLDHGRRQVDALRGEHLHQRLGDDASAVIAACRTAVAEVPWLIDVDGDIEIDCVGEAEEEVGEERSGWSSADHRDSRTVDEHGFTLGGGPRREEPCPPPLGG